MSDRSTHNLHSSFNATWSNGIKYKGKVYDTPRALYANVGTSHAVPYDIFYSRLYSNRSNLTDEVINECLSLSIKEYQKRHRTRATWVELGGEKISIQSLSERVEDLQVSYGNFRRRVLRLSSSKNLTPKTVDFAATATQSEWVKRYNSGRSIPFEYSGSIHPHLVGIRFSSISAFLAKIGRYDDRALIRRRLAAKWDIDAALEEPVIPIRSRKHRIYKIVRKRTGEQYIGLTINSLQARFSQHVSKSTKGSTSPLHMAIKMDGRENFEISLIEDNLSGEEVGERERYWIDFLGTRVPAGLNVKLGGELGSREIGRPVEYNGVQYASKVEAITALVKEHGLPEHIVSRRLSRGDPLPEKVRKVSNHPMAGSKPFRRWLAMINRFEKKGGGAIDSSWMDFDKYYADTGDPPYPSHKLCRKDSSKAWSRDNFEWISQQERMERLKGTIYEIDGVQYSSLAALSEAYGIGATTLRNRISQQGMTPAQAIATPMGVTSRKGKEPIVIDGREFPSMTRAARTIAAETDNSVEVIRYRLRKGLDVLTGIGRPSENDMDEARVMKS